MSKQNVTHIIDDYKIAASLINSFWPRLVSDKDNYIEIAQEMIKNKYKKNDLEKYISRKTNLINLIRIDAIDIIDFPRFDLEYIKAHITLGSYQIEQSYSFLYEHFKQDGTYSILVSNDIINENEFKIVGAEVQSRHSQSFVIRKYQVFVKYLPNNEDSSSLSWCCSCMTGSRTVGCCTHVAMIIYYLAYGKYISDLPTPGYTLNEFLINRDDNISDEEEQSKSVSATLASEDLLASSLKRSCSISFTPNAKRSTYSMSVTPTIDCQNKINFRTVSNHLPEWGGLIHINQDNFIDKKYLEDCQLFEKIKIVNTCSVDYFLLGLWCAKQLSNNFCENLLENSSNIDKIWRWDFIGYSS
jgi:hypothetical protein